MKKTLSILTAFVMLLTMALPFNAFAEQSYDVVCNDCIATLDMSDPENIFEITQAEAGTTVYLLNPAVEDGYYFSEYGAAEQDVVIQGNSFVMPAHAVNIFVAVGEKHNYTIDLSGGSFKATVMLVSFFADSLPEANQKALAHNGDGEFDLDNDGIGDVEYSYDDEAFYPTQNALDKGFNSVTASVTNKYSPVGDVEFIFPKKEKYTVIWQLDDGTEFARVDNVLSGTVLNCPKTPVKAMTPIYTYEFAGWSPAEGAITADTVYTATFTKTERTRTVTWKNYNGKVLQTKTIGVTQSVPAYTGSKPTRPKDATFKYTFSKWATTTDKTTGDVVCTAQYNKSELPAKITASNKTYKKSQKTKQYTVTLKIDGKVAKGKKLTLKVSNKTYTAKTNAKGKATFKIKNLTKKGTYKATISYKGKTKTTSKKATIKVK